MTTRARSFFSFSSLRWWGSPQTSTWTWRLINQLPVERKDLTREVEGQPQRIEHHRTAPNLRVRVRAYHCSEGATE
jgi:hypothetical protein